jgi:hypothetical protein
VCRAVFKCRFTVVLLLERDDIREYVNIHQVGKKMIVL